VERVDALVEAKRRIFDWYEQGLKGVPYLSFQREKGLSRSIYWMTSIALDAAAPLNRDRVIKELKAVNIDTRPTFPSISGFKFWPRQQASPPVSQRIAANGINLPSGVCLRREQVDYVCAQLRKVLV
jgi:perosamine synthetase